MVSASECLFHFREKSDNWFVLNVYSGAKVKRIFLSSKITNTRVRTGPGNSWNFVLAFSRTGKSWKSVKLE